MTYKEVKKFLKNVIAYPLKPDGENKYPNYWRAKFNEILHLLDEQAEVLRILKPFMFVAKDYEPCCFTYIAMGANDEGDLLNKRDLPEKFATIEKWLEEKE